MHLWTILRNIFSNWMGYLVTLLVGFLLAPFVVHHLGNTGYGVWTLILSLTGYFGLLDLGIRSSVGRFVARYVTLNDEENVNRTVSTAFAILGMCGLLALFATLVLYFAFRGFHVERGFQSVARTALLVAGLSVSLALPLGVFSAVLIAIERFDILSRVTIMGAVTRATLVVILLKNGHGLIALALVTLLVGTAEYSAMAAFAKSLYPPLKLRLHLVDLASCRTLFGFGIYRFIWIISNQLIFYTDSVVIGVFLNAAAITYYAIAGSLVNYARNFVSLATDTLYPAATRLDSTNDLAGLRSLQIVGTKIALLIALPLCLGFVFLGRQFIILWMGKDYAISATYLIVLTIPQLTSFSQYTSALILAGMAKHRILAYLALTEGLANLFLSIILVRKIGLIGVAWGTVIPHLVNTALIIPLYTLRTLRMKPAEYVTKAYVRPALCAIPAAGLCYAFSRLVESVSWFVFGTEVFAVCGVFAILSYFFCFDSGQRALVAEKVQRFLHREPIIREA